MAESNKAMAIASGDGNNQLRVKLHKANAIKHLDLMHEAIEAGDYKKAMRYKTIASVAIDEMVSASELVQKEKQ